MKVEGKEGKTCVLIASYNFQLHSQFCTWCEILLASNLVCCMLVLEILILEIVSREEKKVNRYNEVESLMSAGS